MVKAMKQRQAVRVALYICTQVLVRGGDHLRYAVDDVDTIITHFKHVIVIVGSKYVGIEPNSDCVISAKLP